MKKRKLILSDNLHMQCQITSKDQGLTKSSWTAPSP